MIKNEKPRRNWPFVAGVGILVIFAGLLVYTIVPPLLTFERLELWSFVGWTTNSAGQVKQATFIFFNNGTRRLTINNFWVNGTLLNSTDWRYDRGLALDTPGSVDVCIAPKSFVFSTGESYNFTVGTASGNRYSFVFRCDEASVEAENLTITECLFILGSYPYNPPYIAVGYRNNGGTPVIITKMYLDDLPYNVNYWTWPHGWPGRTGPEEAIVIDYGWRQGQTYTIRLETVVGNTNQRLFTAPTR